MHLMTFKSFNNAEGEKPRKLYCSCYSALGTVLNAPHVLSRWTFNKCLAGSYYRAHTVLGAGEIEINRLSPDLMGLMH